MEYMEYLKDLVVKNLANSQQLQQEMHVSIRIYRINTPNNNKIDI